MIFGYIGMELRKIFGFEDWDYCIDLDNGDVYSMNYAHTGKVKKLKTQVAHNDYLRVVLCKDSHVKACFVHRLVWTTYNQMAVPKGMQVNHIDENKSNNSYTNLNLLPPKDNSNWGTRNQRISEHMKGNTNGRFSFKYTFEMLAELAKPYKTSGEFYKHHKNEYAAAWKKGWLQLLFPKP